MDVWVAAVMVLIDEVRLITQPDSVHVAGGNIPELVLCQLVLGVEIQGNVPRIDFRFSIQLV